MNYWSTLSAMAENERKRNELTPHIRRQQMLDEFAKIALSKLPCGDVPPKRIAEIAYEIANAMMVEREQRLPECLRGDK